MDGGMTQIISDNLRYLDTHSLGGGRFWPTVGRKLLKPSAIKAIFLGRPSGSTALNMQPPSRRAELPGALASRGAGDALREAGKLYERHEP
jgi:hypothetical protein